MLPVLQVVWLKPLPNRGRCNRDRNWFAEAKKLTVHHRNFLTSMTGQRPPLSVAFLQPDPPSLAVPPVGSGQPRRPALTEPAGHRARPLFAGGLRPRARRPALSSPPYLPTLPTLPALPALAYIDSLCAGYYPTDAGDLHRPLGSAELRLVRCLMNSTFDAALFGSE